MDKLFTIIVGGSLVGFLALIGVVAVSNGFIFQGAMVGFLTLVFAWGLMMTLADI